MELINCLIYQKPIQANWLFNFNVRAFVIYSVSKNKIK